MCWIGSPFSPSSDLTAVLNVPPSLIPHTFLISKSYWLSFKSYPKFKYFSPSYYYLGPNQCPVSPGLSQQPPNWDSCVRLSLWGVSSTPQMSHFEECQAVSLLYSKLVIGLSKVLCMTDVTPYDLFSMTPRTSLFLLWPHSPPHWPWTWKQAPHLLIVHTEIGMLFLQMAARGALLLPLGLFSKATFFVNFIWPSYLKSQHLPSDISYTLSLPYKNDSL